jgi:hypothetical protein
MLTWVALIERQNPKWQDFSFTWTKKIEAANKFAEQDRAWMR